MNQIYFGLEGETLYIETDIKVSEVIIEKDETEKVFTEVTRCKNCKRWDTERAKRHHQPTGYCILYSGFCEEDKYCAWGEQK